MINRKGFALSLLFFLLTLAGCRSRLDLTRSSTQLNVGVRAAESNLWREALFRFQRAVQIDPADAMAHNNLAVAYEGIGDFEKARAAYIEALRLDRGNAHIQKNYSRFVEFTTKNRKRERKEETAKTAKAKDDEVALPPVKPPAADLPPPMTPPTLDPQEPESRSPADPPKPPATTTPGGRA